MKASRKSSRSWPQLRKWQAVMGLFMEVVISRRKCGISDWFTDIALSTGKEEDYLYGAAKKK